MRFCLRGSILWVYPSVAVNSKSAFGSSKTEFATMFCLRWLWRADDPITMFCVAWFHFCQQYLLFVFRIFQCTGNIRILFQNPLYPSLQNGDSGYRRLCNDSTTNSTVRSSNTARGKIFFPTSKSPNRPLEPIQPPIQCVTGFFPKVKATGTWSLPLISSAKIKNLWSHTTTPPCFFMEWTRMTLTLQRGGI